MLLPCFCITVSTEFLLFFSFVFLYCYWLNLHDYSLVYLSFVCFFIRNLYHVLPLNLLLFCLLFFFFFSAISFYVYSYLCSWWFQLTILELLSLLCSLLTLLVVFLFYSVFDNSTLVSIFIAINNYFALFVPLNFICWFYLFVWISM